MKYFSATILLIFSSATFIQAAPKSSKLEYNTLFCKEEWIRQKCVHDCGNAELCTEWVHDKCKICNFTPTTPDEQSISTSSQDSQNYSYCSADWLKHKCSYDCQEKDLCTPWVIVQCGKCNFAANNTHQPAVKIPENANSKPETTHNFCNTEWLQQKCQYDCRDMPELCNPWVLVQCGKCNFAANNTHQPAVKIPENANTKPETPHNVCNTAWLKQKCQYDCEDMPELCTPWVQVQCKICNF